MATKLLAPVVIGTADNGIRASDSGGAFTASIAAGTYYITGDGESDDLLAAIETALEAGGASDDWSVTISAGIVSIADEDNAWSIDWDHADSTFPCATIGVTDASAAFSGASGVVDSGDAQHLYGWYSTNSYRVWLLREGGYSRQHIAAGGNVYSYSLESVREWRDLGFTVEPGHKIVPRSGYTNQDFGTGYFPYMATNNLSRFYPDSSDSETYTTGIWERDSCARFEPRRFSIAVDLWDFDLVLLSVTDVEPSAGAVYADFDDGANVLERFDDWGTR